MSRTILAMLLVLGGLAAVPLPSPAGEVPRLELSVSGGGLLPLSDDLREVFDAGVSLRAGLAGRVRADRDTWIFAEVNRMSDEGSEYGFDPTFRLDGSELRLVSLVTGIRSNLLAAPTDEPIALYLEFATVWTFARYRPPLGDSGTAVAPGLAFALRPQVALSDTWHLWARQRLALALDGQFDDAVSRDFNLSTLTTEVGVAWRR